MRAIVLVGGEGTRLRPLTWRTPKQLVPVVNRPLIEHLLNHLCRHGVRHVTLAMTQRGESIRTALGDGAALGVELDYAYEETPLGSGGAIARVGRGWRHRGTPASEPFLVLNGDILTDLDVGAMAAAHRARGAELSIGLVRVDDPSSFGVAVLQGAAAGGRPEGAAFIERFVEKPPAASAPSHWANAGIWIFEPALLDEMDADRFHRVEEELFPSLADAGRSLLGVVHGGYWRDVGTPSSYLGANLDLVSAGATGSGELRTDPGGGDRVLVGSGSQLGEGALVRGPAVLGPDCSVASGAVVTRSVLWEGVHVAEGARVAGSILASGAVVEPGASIDDAVIAHGARVPTGATVSPGTTIEPGATAPGPERSGGG